ncbi:hypothetical protein ACWCQN_28850 [Streptomyces sp. NPDC001984]|uniref:hypothetical protein n=1 Tax=Streptomyces sp. NPDC002619 TaxID=3364655 RepID=UPI0036B0332A
MERRPFQRTAHGIHCRLDGRRKRRPGAAGAVQPALPALQCAVSGRLGERVDEGPVGQAEQAPGRLGRQARLQGVLLRVPLDLVGQALAQPRPVGLVGEPVSRDGGGGWRHPHRQQLRVADELASPQLRRAVRTAGHDRQFRRPGPSGAPP